MKQTRCACKGFFLDKFIQPFILLELYHQDRQGIEILKQLKDMEKFEKLDPTGFYRMLKKMEESEMITSHWNITENEKPIKIYSITDSGKICLQTWKHTLKQYSKDIEELVVRISEKTK
jgi:PadR family transcriptional regulator, regulatory protein PadR